MYYRFSITAHVISLEIVDIHIAAFVFRIVYNLGEKQALTKSDSRLG